MDYYLFEEMRIVMDKLAPLGNNVIVKPESAEQVSKGGLFIPDTAKEKPQEGEVIAIGPGKRNKSGALLPMEVKAGDKVIYAKYGGSEIKIGDEKYILMSENDILAVKSSSARKKTTKEKKNG
jgi:chaperonin GroES